MQNSVEKSRGSILVVDDEPVITQLLTAILHKDGYAVATSSDGASAIETAGHLRPDLIVMDIVMPNLDGYDTTTQIRSNPILADVPIIFLTGRPPSEDRGRAFQSGGSLYLKKPFSNTQLLMLVNLTLGN